MLLYVAFMKQRFCERLTVRITIIRPEDVIIITNWEIKLFIAPTKAFYQIKLHYQLELYEAVYPSLNVAQHHVYPDLVLLFWISFYILLKISFQS